MTDQVDGLIGKAAHRVADGWAALRAEAASPDEARVQIATITDAVRRTLHGQSGPTLGLAPSPLGRRILGLLRTRFLELASETSPRVEGEPLLAVLNAMETVAAALEPNWEARVADRLSGPEALDLVVEVAHDLRSPLTSILFLAETLKRARSGPVSPLQERQLGLIYSAAFGLSSVASDVIELVRGGERLLATEEAVFSVPELTESVRDIVLPIVEEKGLEIRVDAGDVGTRTGQPVALSRILLNLVTNALKFTEAGQVELAANAAGGDAVEFSVSDTGRGIPAEALALLFEPFRRRNRAGEYAFSGSGLGLSICRKLVEAMGSELVVQTDLGRGTRFSFTIDLPVAAAHHTLTDRH
ncbi:MAG: sensor histidine kinase [Gemmatimonadales bacterium]